MADAPALGAGAAKAAWRFDPSLAYQAGGPGPAPDARDGRLAQRRFPHI